MESLKKESPLLKMQGDDFHPEYPRNVMGLPEFCSMMLTLDHMLDKDPFHVHQKAVFSTETPDQALLSLLKYTGDSRMDPYSPAVMDAVLKLRVAPESTIVVYSYPVTMQDRSGGQIAQVVMSNLAWKRFKNHPELGNGSDLLACNALVAICCRSIVQAAEGKGIIRPIITIALEDAPMGDPGNPPGQIQE